MIQRHITHAAGTIAIGNTCGMALRRYAAQGSTRHEDAARSPLAERHPRP